MRTLGAILCTLLLSGFSAPRSGATVYHSNGSAANVQALQNAAHDGDTITLPAGTFSWTSRPNITKGITLQGRTTITGAGTANPTATDATIILDNVPRSSGILGVNINASQSFRMTGITFKAGSTTPGTTDGAFTLSSASSTSSFRIDHCHFAVYAGKLIHVTGYNYGVADHNFIEVFRSSFPFNLDHTLLGSGENGNGTWSDYPWYGTGKFFFIEDNTLIRSQNTLPNSLVDSFYGGRWVARHNYMKDMIPSGHGTEAGAARGERTSEFYDNTVNITVLWGGGGLRSGTTLWHDNIFIGRDSSNGAACNLSNNRETPLRGVQPPYYFTVADGTCPWDQNDTEGNGTYVQGHPPYLFASGSAAGGTTINGSRATFTDSTKHWTRNQWAGYSIESTNPSSACYLLGSYIISNTATTITYSYSAAAPQRLIFNTGDSYEIHRVLVMMDQCGRGRTLDAIYSPIINGQPHPLNPRCGGCRLWPRSQLEPCYSWNNVYTPTNHVLDFGGGRQPTTKPGIDYFNLGAGFPADTTPSAVSSRYTAALNGVDYTGTFIYPHPLVTAEQSPTTDFNNDGKPDYLLDNSSTGQTVIWYLNKNVVIGAASGPTLPPGYSVAGVADFNRDGHADYLLSNSSTRQTVIWYLNNNVVIGAASGPTLPPGYSVTGVADFNGDGKPDCLLYNSSTGQTVIWYLNNNVVIGAASGPTLPPSYSVAGVEDFNGDGKPDYLLSNSSTGQTVIWYLNNNVVIGAAVGPTITSGYELVGAADFNGDGKSDYLLYNSSTRQTAIWYMNNNVLIGTAGGPTLPSGWSLVAP